LRRKVVAACGHLHLTCGFMGSLAALRGIIRRLMLLCPAIETEDR
jgi:hypothetical protein